jgi:hypothetical protein
VCVCVFIASRKKSAHSRGRNRGRTPRILLLNARAPASVAGCLQQHNIILEPTIVRALGRRRPPSRARQSVGGVLQRRLTTQRAHRRARATPFTANRAATGYCSKGILFCLFISLNKRHHHTVSRRRSFEGVSKSKASLQRAQQLRVEEGVQHHEQQKHRDVRRQRVEHVRHQRHGHAECALYNEDRIFYDDGLLVESSQIQSQTNSAFHVRFPGDHFLTLLRIGLSFLQEV